jgi:hypothetical protein
MKKKNIGSTFDSWLRKEDIYEEVSESAIKRVIARQIASAMSEKGITKSEMARRMERFGGRWSHSPLEAPAPVP